MADNITLNPGTGGAAVRTIGRAGVETQVMLLDIGGTGAESLVTDANPLPVAASALPLPTGAATASAQATGNTTLASILTALGQTLAVGGSVTVSNLPATQPVSGTVTANAGTGTFAISAASLPLPTGAATSAKQDAIITALGSPLQAGGSVSIAGTVPVTGTFWQATQPVSGPLTNAELRAAPVPVTMPNMTLASYSQAGVITINTDLLVIDCQGLEGLSIQCAAMGTAGVVTPAWSNDGTNYQAATIMTPAGAGATTFNAAGLWTTPVLARYLRLRLTTATTAGTTTLAVQGIAQAANFPVAAQPVSGSVSVSSLPQLAASTNAVGDVGLQYRANATGAASIFSLLSQATPAATSVKASAGRLLGMSLVNTAAALRSVKFWNTAAASVTLGTTAAIFEVDLAAGQRVDFNLPGGIGFATAITVAVTGAKGLTDNTGSLGASDVSGVLFFA